MKFEMINAVTAFYVNLHFTGQLKQSKIQYFLIWIEKELWENIPTLLGYDDDPYISHFVKVLFDLVSPQIKTIKKNVELKKIFKDVKLVE